MKYHLGAEGGYLTADDEEVRVVLSPNPSHLEAVDPVIEGRTRAEQTDRSGAMASVNPASTLPVLIHGDAAFAAQGVVAETLNLARLDGYATGGTVHLIANNQVGFTTGPREGRSTDYSSDLAKGFDAPIVHVNADDPEACLAAARLAMMYRERFGHDVVIDLVGYRRYGHNEGDEPAYSQPAMYARIAEHPSVRELYQAQLVEAGRITAEEAEAQDQGGAEGPRAAPEVACARASRRAARASSTVARRPSRRRRRPSRRRPCRSIGCASSTARSRPCRTGFTIHPKLEKQLERRATALDADEAHVDWGHAELLAFASLLAEGTPIRLTGQDTVRGTFSQRHAGLWDARTAERHVPLQHLPGTQASFELHNSPLSEYAALGFEYGYAVTAPDALVLWEAQYGDFVNGAEIILDQFLVSGLAKWRLTSRLTLLLPHGYEGSGPEHSSARLERFLALGAEGNIRVVYPTTPAQYFHLLRRQARHPDARPLVLMTPKSLLRLPRAMSRPSELASGAFRSVLDDPRFADARCRGEGAPRPAVQRQDLLRPHRRADEFEAATDVAIIRSERLYPFPDDELPGRPRPLPEDRVVRLGAGGAAQHGRTQVRAPAHPPPRAVQDSARRHLAARALAAGRGLPGGAPRRAGPHRARGAHRALTGATGGDAVRSGAARCTGWAQLSEMFTTAMARDALTRRSGTCVDRAHVPTRSVRPASSPWSYAAAISVRPCSRRWKNRSIAVFSPRAARGRQTASRRIRPRTRRPGS